LKREDEVSRVIDLGLQTEREGLHTSRPNDVSMTDAIDRFPNPAQSVLSISPSLSCLSIFTGNQFSDRGAAVPMCMIADR
jgi:hypothetical protein